MKLLVYLLTLVAATIVASCSEEKKQQLTPWGTTLEAAADSIPDDFTLDDILNNGELIMLTLTGPETYYDYHGNASRFKKRNRQFTWFGPTNLGVQITYDLVYRKKGGER